MDSKTKHDFINNSLRIEVLNKLIGEKLENNLEPENEHVEDLKQFLADHLEYLKKL